LEEPFVISAARKVVITDHTYPTIDLEEQTLAPLGAKIAEGQCQTPEAVLALGGDADALIVQFSPITREVIEGLFRCKIIARCGIGVDNIDIAAATERGIWVTNVPDYCIDEVADHTLGMLVAANRRICALDRAARELRWDVPGVAGPVHRLRGQVLGLIGLGRIGHEVAQRAAAFGMRIIVSDPFLSEEKAREAGAWLVDLDTLLATADVVSLHAPLNDDTRHIMNAESMRKMKPGAILINTARGPLVNEADLADALRRGIIGGAAIDVLSKEPPDPDNPLLNLPPEAAERLVLTPHAAYYSLEALDGLRIRPAQEVVRVLSGEVPINPLNKPKTQQF
jgi:D-3-phosphoglycerate dehydrogenase